LAVTAPPANPPEVDDGVIEEARRRQRRRRGRAGALVLATAAIASGLALVRGGVGDGGTYPNVGAVRGSSGPLRLAFVRGLPYLNGQPFPLSVTPSLKAGSVGVTVMTPTVGGSVPYPAVSTPLWGDEGSYEAPVVPAPGEIDYALAEPRVAAVRVAGIGTFKPVALPGLPPGVRLVVFSRTAGSRGIVLPPDPPPDVGTWIPPALRHTPLITMTPLDLQGHVIPSSTSRGQPAFQLPYTYWQVTGTRRKTCKVLPGAAFCVPPGPAPRTESSDGRCALRSNATDVRVLWGQAATAIAPDPRVAGPAFLSCLQEWYTRPGETFQAAILLNAQHPGAPPANLWGARPVPGHRGLIQIPPVQWEQTPPAGLRAKVAARLTPRYGRARAQTLAQQWITQQWTHTGPRIVARRAGNAWLVVQQGSLPQEIAFLNSLSISRLNLN